MTKIKEKTVAIYVWILIYAALAYGLILVFVLVMDLGNINKKYKRQIQTKNQIIDYLEGELDNCENYHLNIN